jgi:crotonobetainyl-CoA:carnitine CoA-transferase CaiB-like acyl-CoA transferase
LDNYLAGNYGPLLLAMHGADVVKVETPAGEAMRGSSPFLGEADGAMWSHFELRMMRGKRSVALDLSDDADRRTFERLVEATDVFWTNLRPESAARRRVDPETLLLVNDRLVYTSLSGFGRPENGAGQLTSLPAFDILVQAASGLLHRNADPDGTPVYNGLPIADQATSLYAAFGVLLGLRQRDRTGAGCVVDVAMFDAMVALNEKAISMYGVDHRPPPPRSSATTAPFGMYPTSDGWVCIAVGSDSVWRKFCVAVGRPELVDDARFSLGTDRVRHQDDITRVVEAFTVPRTKAEVAEELLRHGVPAGEAHEVDDIVDSPQVRDRGTVRDLDLGGAGRYPVVMSPVHVSGSAQRTVLPPRLDADHHDVLAEWLADARDDRTGRPQDS